MKRHSEPEMLAVVKNPGEKSGLEPDCYRSESTALSTQPNPHLRA